MAVGKPASKGSPEEAKERLVVEAAQKELKPFSELYENTFERVYALIARENRQVSGRTKYKRTSGRHRGGDHRESRCAATSCAHQRRSAGSHRGRAAGDLPGL